MSNTAITITRRMPKTNENNTPIDTNEIPPFNMKPAPKPVYAFPLLGTMDAEPSKHTISIKHYRYEIDEDAMLEELKAEGYSLIVGNRSHRFVSDGIGADYKKWDARNPVFISAQTGSGKNHFLENVLLKHVEALIDQDNNERNVLILSNRIALDMQIKNRVEKSGVARVLTYQSLEKFLNNNIKLDKYKYVVCDESHFFTSDSMFNPNTHTILHKIISLFPHAVRIYMSSTFHECLKYIFDMETNSPYHIDEEQAYVKPAFNYYKFERDYSYLDIKYFTHHTEPDMLELIIKSVGNGEKWLVLEKNYISPI